MADPSPISAPASPPERVVTRFAPSPTGELHLGNARTALFNLLLARHHGGRFVLRIEDTDTERSREEYRQRQMADLSWLGLTWDAGPDREDALGPYRQSQRGPLYQHYFEVLERADAVYSCFCSTLELEVSRRAQLAAGKPPRYAGTCRELSAEQRARRLAQGISPTLRFRVPGGRRIEFTDLVHGSQSFATDDIGDFVVRRADGTAAFFFSNAVDDAAMGITHVLRGEDHLANTPRQLLLLEALALPAPHYGHVSLLLGRDGAPLSKRTGATSVAAFREQGYLATALLNLLFRLGHSSAEHGLLSLEQLVRHFDTSHLGRAPAHFDAAQLVVWQREAVHRLAPAAAREWLAGVLPAGLEPDAALAFVSAVQPNLLLPADAQRWSQIIFGPPPPLGASEQQLVREAGGAFFAAAAQAAAEHGADLRAIAGAARAVSGRKAAALYLPLRAALTGRAEGPELAPLIKALPPGATHARLARFAGPS
ncbi:MAG TPA: glutamate--tRNA ligase [Steroidobacteraceae bacterium]|nr:glutamate--tRNA ligase [Steroidobacteraceae bacterium]